MGYTIVIGHVITYLKCEVCQNYFFSETHYNTHPCALSKIEPTDDEIKECKLIDLKYDPPKIIELEQKPEPEVIELETILIKPQKNLWRYFNKELAKAPQHPDRAKINVNPPCPECNGITAKQGIIVTRKKGVRQRFRCVNCGCTFREPYTHSDLSNLSREITESETETIRQGEPQMMAVNSCIQQVWEESPPKGKKA